MENEYSNKDGHLTSNQLPSKPFCSFYFFIFYFFKAYFCACFLVVPVDLSSSVNCESATVTDTEAKSLQLKHYELFPLSLFAGGRNLCS